MTPKNERMKKKAARLLSHVGNDIQGIDCEMVVVNELSDVLNAKKEDAKWDGDTDHIHRIRYALKVNNHKRRLLLKRRKAIMREME